MRRLLHPQRRRMLALMLVRRDEYSPDMSHP